MKKPPYRLWIGVMVFFTAFTNYMLGANMSVSIVDMVVPKNGTQIIPACLKDKNITLPNKTTTRSELYEKYEWTEHQVGDVLSSYFYGYTIAIAPSGTLAELLGPWLVIFVTSVGSTVLTALTPITARMGPIALSVNRGFTGLLGVWCRISGNECASGTLGTTQRKRQIFGGHFWTVVGSVTAQYGWPWGFYVLAMIMGVYCIFFFFIVSDSPDKSRWVSQEELDFIARSQEGHLSKKKALVPYCKMLKSVPVWALIVTHFGNVWALNLMLTYSPKFMKETVGFDLEEAANLAAVPYVARFICSCTFGIVGDWLRTKEILSVTKIRKYFIIFSHLLPSACFFLMRAAGCNTGGVIALLVLSQAFNSAIVITSLMNPQDLTPNFVGSCYGLMHTIGMTTGLYVPKITAAISIYYNRDLKAAAFIYTMGGIFLAFGGLVFFVFGSGEVQPWNAVEEEDEGSRS